MITFLYSAYSKMSFIEFIQICLRSDTNTIEVIYGYETGLRISYKDTSILGVIIKIANDQKLGSGNVNFPDFPDRFKDLFIGIYQPGIEYDMVFDGVKIYALNRDGGAVYIYHLETERGPLVAERIEVKRTMWNEKAYVIFYGKCGKVHFEDHPDRLGLEVLPTQEYHSMVRAFDFMHHLDEEVIECSLQMAYGQYVKVVFHKVELEEVEDSFGEFAHYIH